MQPISHNMQRAIAASLSVYDDYAAWTDIVAQYPPTAEAHYLALGIADEAGEMSVANQREDIIKEAGDTLWYCARYATKVLGVPFSEVVTDSVHTSSRHPIANIGIIAGFEKKRIRDGVNWDEITLAQKKAKAYTALCGVIAWTTDLLDRAGGVSLAYALVVNRDKLTARLEAGTVRGDGDNR